MVAAALDKGKLAAALLVCASFGSIHAYGVLLIPVSEWLGVGRASASLGYSVAILALTAGVFVNGRLSGRIPPGRRLIFSAVLAAAGLACAALATGLASLIFGFGLLYGLANGIGYATSLELAAAALPGREAKGIGLATAAYGLGSMAFALIFALLLPAGIAFIFLALAVVLSIACLAGFSLAGREIKLAPVSPSQDRTHPARGGLLLWIIYLLGAFSGLMVIAHAPALALAYGAGGGSAGVASGLISFGGVAGGYLGGVIAERLPHHIALFAPLLAQAIALSAVVFLSGGAWVLVGLAATGLCYGILISAVPAVVRSKWGAEGFAPVYGRVFTAWGLAGLAGPLMAGLLFDVTSHYGAALLAAATISLVACGLTFRMEKQC